MKAFGQRFKELRIEKGLSQTQIAEILNVSQSAVTKWETGRAEPTASNIEMASSFFNCTADYLLGLENDYGIIQSISSRPTKTLNEMELLEAFRSLDEDEQQAIIQTAKIMQKAKIK